MEDMRRKPLRAGTSAPGATVIEATLQQYTNTIVSTLQEKQNEIVSSVRQEEQRLQAERQAIQSDREAMEADLEAKTAKLDQERATFEAEKKSVAAMNKVLKSKLKLDVGGTPSTTSRTTLTSVPGSMLETMFSGRHVLQEDEEGRVFIDRDGEKFKLVLEYLRSPTSFSLDGLSKRDVASCLVEFEYYGLPSPVPPVPPLDLKMNVYNGGYTKRNLQDDKCTITHGNSGSWGWGVGAEVLADDAVWKMRVNQMSTLMMGVIVNATPSSQNAHADATFAGWNQAGYFYQARGNHAPGWPGWQQGDEAIFALNASARTLTVHLKRTRQSYTYSNLPAGNEGQWRVCADFNANTNVVLSAPTDEEIALVK